LRERSGVAPRNGLSRRDEANALNGGFEVEKVRGFDGGRAEKTSTGKLVGVFLFLARPFRVPNVDAADKI
jgi:hypothetical protein